MRDLYSNLGVAVLLASATYAADSTPASVDLDGFDSALLAIEVGAGGITFTTSNKVEFVLTHSDDDTTYTNVADADVIGVTGITGGIVKSLVAAHAAADVSLVGYIGGKRYLKLLADFSGTHGTGTPLSALVIKGQPRIKPVNAS
jgi:hypothetical protein